MPKIKLTDTVVTRDCVAIGGKTTWYNDTETRGLQLCVTPAGARTWYVNKWDPKAEKTRRIKLGPFASKGTHTRWARDQVGKKVLDVIEGRAQTRVEQEQERAGIPTLREAFDREMQFRRTRGAAYGGPIHANTDADYTRAFDRYLATWGTDKMDEIDVGAIQRALDDLSEEKPFAPHKVNIVLGMTFDRASRMIGAPLQVLTPKLDKNPTMQQRDIDFTVEWTDRWAEIEAVENEHKRLAWMCRWYTGMRGDMLRKLKWDDIDLDAGTMMVRTGLKKVKGARLIAMSDQVKQWFVRLNEIRFDDCEFVFPSRRIVRGKKRGPLDRLDRLPLTCEGDLRHLWNVATHDVDTREMVLRWLCGQALTNDETKNLGLYGMVPVERQRKVANEIASVIDSKIGRAGSRNVIDLKRAAS